MTYISQISLINLYVWFLHIKYYIKSTMKILKNSHKNLIQRLLLEKHMAAQGLHLLIATICRTELQLAGPEHFVTVPTPFLDLISM